MLGSAGVAGASLLAAGEAGAVLLVGAGEVLLPHLRRIGEADDRARAESRASKLLDCILLCFFLSSLLSLSLSLSCSIFPSSSSSSPLRRKGRGIRKWIAR